MLTELQYINGITMHFINIIVTLHLWHFILFLQLSYIAVTELHYVYASTLYFASGIPSD